MQGERKRGPISLEILPMLAIVLSVLEFSSCSGARPSVGERVLGIEELTRLDLLPRLKQSVKIGCASSYDPTGENDDGFSGKYSFIRKEPEGLVIADLQGPGVIYRIQLPSPTDEVIEFYFDGESKPRISRKIPELFEGNIRPFLSPLVGAGVGGRFSYVPLTYQRSCKIIIKTETLHFFQINYARYPDGFVIPTYQDPPSEDFRRQLVSQRADGPAVDVRAEVVFANLGRAADEGKFYARWRRENPCAEGKP